MKESTDFSPFETHKPLAQKYVKSVKLLDGFKFTMRIYVAITGADPFVSFCKNPKNQKIERNEYNFMYV